MEALSFRNNYYQDSSDIQKRLNNEESFTALDREKLKQDTVELTAKTTEGVKDTVRENWFYKQLRKLGVEDPKKTTKSVIYAIITTVAFAMLGNKLSNKTANLGQKLGDEIIGNSKPYKFLQKVGAGLKKGLSKAIDSNKYTKEIKTTLTQRREHVKLDVARGYGQGFLGIFSLTPVEIMQKAFARKGCSAEGFSDVIKTISKKLKIDNTAARKLAEQIIKDASGNTDKAANVLNEKLKLEDMEAAKQLIERIVKGNNDINKATEILNKTFNMDSKVGRELVEQILGTAEKKLTRKEICEMMSEGIRKGLGCTSKKQYLEALQDMQTNVKYSDFFNVEMKDKGFGAIASSWWPANIINKVTKGKFQRHLTGNLGDSLIKFNVVNGTMAETKAGTFIQRLITIPTESISNFVNDKSGVGAFISASCMIPLYNNVQDAPKEKKLPTILNDYVGGMGTFALSLPVASGITYGVASLANLDTKGKLILKPLKAIGKFFRVGLKDVDKNAGFLKKAAGKMGGVFGGVMRFILIMFALSPVVSKIINKVVAKVFGEPYDPDAEKKAKELEEQKNTVIPELGITQGELQERIEKNPQAIQDMQNNQKLVEAIDKNPKLLLDVLDGKEVKLDEQPKQTSTNATQSPMLASMLNNNKNISNEADLFGLKKKEKTAQEDDEFPKDSATYIPSSEFKAQEQPLSDLTKQEYDRLMNNADKALAKAEKFI